MLGVKTSEITVTGGISYNALFERRFLKVVEERWVKH